MTWILPAAGLAALAVFLFLVYIAIRYVPIIERNAFEVPRHRAPEAPSAPRAAAREFAVACPDGTTLTALRAAPRGQKRGVAVFCHETGAGASSWAKHAAFLPEAGYEVVAFDYESGPETCQWPAQSELKKIEAVLGALWRESKETPVFVFGVSKGSVLAAGTLWHPAVRCAVLDGIFVTRTTMENYMKKWTSIYVTPEAVARAVPHVVYAMLSRLVLVYASIKKKDRYYSVENFSSRFHKPALFIHASKDHIASLADVEFARKHFRAPTELWVAEGAGHSESARKRPDAYRDHILSFLDTHLAGGAG